MTLLPFERRWAQAVLGSFAPSASQELRDVRREGLVPVEGEVDYLRAYDLMCEASTPKAQLGLRLALWIFALAPIWSLVAPRSLAGLPVDRRTALLEKLLASKVYIVRELGLLLKLAVAFALMASPTVRARCGYDRRGGVAPVVSRPLEVAPVAANERRPRALPVLSPSLRPSHTGAA